MSTESEAGKTAFKIKATGNVAWAVCIAALAVAIVAILVSPATLGTSVVIGGAVETFMAPVVVTTLGFSAASGAITIAIAGGGVGILNKLRKYKMKKENGKIILLKK